MLTLVLERRQLRQPTFDSCNAIRSAKPARSQSWTVSVAEIPIWQINFVTACLGPPAYRNVLTERIGVTEILNLKFVAKAIR
jgi:hypothetical protein